MFVRDMHSPIHNYSIVLRRHHRQGSWQFMASRLVGNWIVCRRLTERPSHNSLRQQEWLRHCAFCVHIIVCLLPYFLYSRLFFLFVSISVCSFNVALSI